MSTLTPNTCKIALASDLHLDFEDINDEFFSPVADVLVLAGDVHEERVLSRQYERFWKRCSDYFLEVVYISGNHEYYHGGIPKVDDKLRQQLQDLKNIHFLQNETFEHKGVTFAGATLWTDVNKGNPVTRMTIDSYMNDWKLIRQSNLDYLRYRPVDSEKYHHFSRKFIEDVLDSKKQSPVVVVTHHAPTCESISPRFKNLYHENYAYYSNLENILLDRETPTYWIHGHIHYPSDYMVGMTRVLCHPRGYPGERPPLLPAYVPKVFEVNL